MADDKPEWLEAMTVLKLEPGDIVMVKAPAHMVFNAEQRQVIESHFAERIGVTVVLMDNGLEIGVVRKAA